MSSEAVSITEFPATSVTQSGKWRIKFARGEDLLVSLALATMVVLPLAEIVLRRTLHASIPASITIVQHMVLVVGMLGGAIAAREQRLLSLSNVGETKLRGWPRIVSRVFTGVIGAAVCGYLCLAAWQFVQSEREAGRILAFGIPVWVLQWVLPLGFAAIALRILWHTSEKWELRLAAALSALFLAGIVWPGPNGRHPFLPLSLPPLLLSS